MIAEMCQGRDMSISLKHKTQEESFTSSPWVKEVKTAQRVFDVRGTGTMLTNARPRMEKM